MKDSDLLTVIVPIYKVEKYLRRCLDSIVDQTYRNLEIILVDDGSPDNCPAICDEYAKKDHRVKAIHQKNAGVSVARNVGLDTATGNYIAFVDADDWLENDAYMRVMDLMKICQADICMFEFWREKSDGIKGFDFADELKSKEQILQQVLNNKINSYVWSCVYKRNIFREEKMRFIPDIVMEDFTIFPWLVDGATEIAILRRKLYHYNQTNSDSISQNDSTVKNAYGQFCGYKNRWYLARGFAWESLEKWNAGKMLRTAIRTWLLCQCKGQFYKTEWMNDVNWCLKNMTLNNVEISMFRKTIWWIILHVPNLAKKYAIWRYEK